jgi:pimeloyl-ACP methyl ester carboxylesterase
MKACHNRPNLHLVLWSRAGLLAQTALRYMDIEAIQFINAAVEKPYGLPEDPSLPNRMSKQFEEAIINTAPGMTTLDRSKAVELLYEDCSERVALKAVSRLTDQRSLKPPPVYSTWIDVPVSFIACDKDRVVNPEWTQRIANEWYNTEPVWLSGGHTPQLAQPVELAYRIMEEAKFQARARLLDRPQPAVQLHTAPR